MNHAPSSSDAFQIDLNPNALKNDYHNYAQVVGDDHTTEGSSSEAQKTAVKKNEDDTQEEVVEEEAADDDHELKTRIEEFINKIHREWQAERLRG